MPWARCGGRDTAHGPLREFWQCDFDLIGTAANAADIEIAQDPEITT